MARLSQQTISLLFALVVSQSAVAGLLPGGVLTDQQTSIIYRAASGELAVDAPAAAELTAVNIHSAAGIFSVEQPRCFGGYCSDLDQNSLFRSTFGDSFGDFTWGNIARAGLAEDFLLRDLTVVGSLQGGGGLGDVDLIYIPVPEPSTVALVCIGLAGCCVFYSVTPLQTKTDNKLSVTFCPACNLPPTTPLGCGSAALYLAHHYLAHHNRTAPLSQALQARSASE